VISDLESCRVRVLARRLWMPSLWTKPSLQREGYRAGIRALSQANFVAPRAERLRAGCRPAHGQGILGIARAAVAIADGTSPSAEAACG
jgi:hypothetical protein